MALLLANASLFASGIVIPAFAVLINLVARSRRALPPSIGSDVLLFWAVVDFTIVIEHEHVSKVLDESIRASTVSIYLSLALIILLLWYVSLK